MGRAMKGIINSSRNHRASDSAYLTHDSLYPTRRSTNKAEGGQRAGRGRTGMAVGRRIGVLGDRCTSAPIVHQSRDEQWVEVILTSSGPSSALNGVRRRDGKTGRGR